MEKNFKGVTLVALTVTIIVLLILASVGSTVGINAVRHANYYDTISDLKVMQTKTNQMYEEFKNGNTEVLNSGKDLSESGKYSQAQKSYQTAKENNLTEKDIGELADYKYYSADYIKNTMGIDGIEKDVLINIKARTVLLLDGIKNDGNTYYSLNEIEGEQYNVEYINPKVVLGQNGGIFVIPNDGKLVIETSESIIDNPANTNTKVQYVWSDSKDIKPTTGWEDVESDGTIQSDEITEEGTKYLWTRIVDEEGNVLYVEPSEAFVAKEQQTYTLTVNPNGGTYAGTTAKTQIRQKTNSAIDLGTLPEADGFTVTLDANDGGTPVVLTAKKTFKEWTLQVGAKGTIKGTTYTFGEGNDTATANWESQSVELPDSTRTGYEFEGWYTKAEGGEKIIDSYTPQVNTTLYAHWIEPSYAEYNGETLVKYYATLADALTGVTSGNTIKALKDRTETDAPTVPEGKTITLDLGGKTTRLDGVTLTNNGTLTITGEGTLTTSSAVNLITNEGTLNLTDSGTISNTNKGNYLVITSTGTINKTGTGTITGYNSTISFSGGFLMSAGTVNVSAKGEIYGGTIAGSGDATAEITGGVIEHNGNKSASAIYWTSSKELVLGGNVKVSATGYGNVTDGQSCAIQNGSTTGGSIIINDGTYSAGNYCYTTIFNNGNDNGKIIIKGGKVTGQADAILNSAGMFTIEGGEVTSNSNGMTLMKGTLVITGGTITGAKSGVSCSTNNNQILEVGKNDDTIKTDFPKITGTATSGIKVGGATFKFYDGAITGPKGKSIDGTVADKPEGSRVIKTTIDGKETAILKNTYIATFLSGNLMNGKELGERLATVTNRDGIYTITAVQTTAGVYIPEGVFEEGKTYILSYKIQKTAGTLLNIAGHSGAATQKSFTIDGETASSRYRFSSASGASSNITDDTNVHTIEFEFTYNPSSYSGNDKKIYIQPNRGYEDSVTIKLSELEIYEVIEEREKTYNTELGELPTQERTGYTLDGWYTGKTDGDKITTTTKVTDDMIYYTHWAPRTYNITFNAGEGTLAEGEGTKQVTYDGTYETLPTPTRNGYVFGGWYTTETDGTEIKSTDTVKITEDTNLYAHWTEIKPVVTLKENDENGVACNDVWTNQNVYAEITMNSDDVNVEKYQYSINGTDWIDIDENQYSAELDYTFGNADKPEFISDLIDTDGTSYHFTQDGTKLTSSNYHVSSSNCRSYIKVDLSDYDEEDVLTVTVNCYISSRASYDYGYVCLTNNSTSPTYSRTGSMEGQIYKNAGNTTTTKTAKDYTGTLTGGKIWYIHLGYYKYSSINTGDDTFTINSINFTSETLGKTMKFEDYTKNGNKVTFNKSEEMQKNLQIRAVQEDSTYSRITNASIKIDKTIPTASYDFDFTGKESANITISDIKDNLSGVKGYYISTEEIEPTAESNWTEITGTTTTIDNLLTNRTYNIWLIDNAGNISDKQSVEITSPNYLVDDTTYKKTLEQAISAAKTSGSEIKLLRDYTDTSTVAISKNLTLNLQEYTLTRTQEITVNSSKTVNIIGSGNITNASSNYTIKNSGTLNLNLTGKIENTYSSTSTYAIYNNNSSSTINMNSGAVTGYNGIYNYGNNNKVTINGGTIIGTVGYGITGSATLVINDGKVTGKNNGIRQNSGSLTMNGGIVEGSTAIYQYSNSTIKILGGTVKGSELGIYGQYTNTITIGDDKIDVNTNRPIILSSTQGIKMKDESYIYNFYNGIITGATEIPYGKTINPRTGYTVFTYYDYDVYKKYCSVLIEKVDNITINQTPSNEEWTNSDVQIDVKYPVINGGTNQLSEDEENWVDVSNVYRTTIAENKTIYARSIDEEGVVVENVTHKITNIDKIQPTITINPEKTKYIIHEGEKANIGVTVTITENESGIKTSKYGWSESRDTEPALWQDFTSGDTITRNNCEEGTYYLWFNVADNAGNKSDIEVLRYIVEEKDYVARIKKDGEEDYDYFDTIQDAIDTAGTENKTIEIIKDTDETSTILSTQNLVIDLNGHIIGSSTTSEPTFKNEGTLKIIDTSNEQTGTIENVLGTAIENNGTLTIGENDGVIKDETPIIYGNKIGINNSGTFNYYDGTIKGKTAIKGEVQDTPEEYGPVGAYENGITVINLRTISEYEARIEWTYYTKLQLAIDACTIKANNKDTTTITILKNITMDRGASIYKGQNITLNLNSYILTSAEDSVITNNGTLDITDLSGEESGTIISSVAGTFGSYYNVIKNLEQITISKGNIVTEKNYNYVIYNLKGELIVNGGKVSNDSYNIAKTIYNVNGGVVTVNDGTISSNGSTSQAIINEDLGTIIINKGTINCNASGSGSEGIYNIGTGTVTINDGTISCEGSAGSGNYALYNNKQGLITVNGGIITGSNNSGRSI